MSFEVWTPDSGEWLAHWSSWPEREVHAHPGYVALYEDEVTRARCAAWGQEPANLLGPEEGCAWSVSWGSLFLGPPGG